MTHSHRDRDRAESFGQDAELYDRARPEYPHELIADLAGGDHPDVLDVGCGTGKASRAFRAAGCSVLGIEIDERMAEVARAGGLWVEVGAFEAWDAAGRSFDLVVSGQAWHWVDPRIAPARAASVLRPAGRLAPFWNHLDPVDDAEALTALYRREAPALLPPGGTLRSFEREGEIDRHVAGIERSGRFEPCEVQRYHWGEVLTTERYLERLATQSEHRLLEAGSRARLFDGLRRLFDERGREVTTSYTTYCIVARRR